MPGRDREEYCFPPFSVIIMPDGAPCLLVKLLLWVVGERGESRSEEHPPSDKNPPSIWGASRRTWGRFLIPKFIDSVAGN